MQPLASSIIPIRLLSFVLCSHFSARSILVLYPPRLAYIYIIASGLVEGQATEVRFFFSLVLPCFISCPADKMTIRACCAVKSSSGPVAFQLFVTLLAIVRLRRRLRPHHCRLQLACIACSRQFENAASIRITLHHLYFQTHS